MSPRSFLQYSEFSWSGENVEFFTLHTDDYIKWGHPKKTKLLSPWIFFRPTLNYLILPKGFTFTIYGFVKLHIEMINDVLLKILLKGTLPQKYVWCNSIWFWPLINVSLIKIPKTNGGGKYFLKFPRSRGKQPPINQSTAYSHQSIRYLPHF